MKPEFLESAEFYNRRYHNFSSRVIVPMSLLLVFCFGFATLAEKEMSLSTRATVEPSLSLQISSQLATIVFLSIIWKKISWLKRGSFWFNIRKGQRVSKRRPMLVSWTCSRIKKAIGVFAKKSARRGEPLSRGG